MKNTPINNLSPDVLIPIFSQIDDFPSSSDNGGDCWQTTSHGTMWPVVRLVCKYWYDVTYDTPLLWQDIQVYAKPDWLGLSLERSGTVLIDVTLRNHRSYASSIPLLIDHADRLRTLAILDSKHGGFHLIKRLLLQELQNLQELRIAGEGYIEDDDYVNLQPPMGRWPAIRVFRLTHLVLPVKFANFGSLRVLDLSHMQGNPKMRTMPLNFALTVLKACQELQELKLNAVFSEMVGRSELLVQLPQLRRLEVVSKVGPTTRMPFHTSPLVSSMILRRVQLPLHASLKFVTHVMAPTMVGYSSFIPTEDPSNIPILTHATFACLRPNSFMCSEPGGGTLEVTVEFDDVNADETWFNQDRQLINMSSLLSRAPITHLSLVSAQLHSEPMAAAFDTFPGLTTLEFSTVPPHHDDGGRELDWRFPALLYPLLLPREAHRGDDVGAPREEMDGQYFAARLPLKNLRVLRLNGLLRDSRIPGLICGCLYSRTTLGATHLSELYVAMYGPKAEDAEVAAKEREEMDKFHTLVPVDGPVVFEDCGVPDSISH